jgi:sugar-specific transcriptional regulator TrmB
MLTPDQIANSGQIIEKICQQFEARLAGELAKLMEFLQQENLSTLERDEAIRKAREIISKAQAELRKKTNAAIISEFKQFTKKSLKDDERTVAEDLDHAHTND